MKKDTEKDLIEKLEIKGFGLQQINIILLANKEGINLESFPVNTDVKLLRTLKTIYKKFDITPYDEEIIKNAIEEGNSIEFLPTDKYIEDTYATYLKYSKIFGEDKINEIYNNAFNDYSFETVCNVLDEKNIDLTEYADLNPDILETFAENKKILSTLNPFFKDLTRQAKDGDVHNLPDICDDVKIMVEKLPENQLLFLNTGNFKMDLIPAFSNFSSYDVDFDKVTEMPFELVKAVISYSKKPNYLDRDINFFKTHKNCDFKTYKILESPFMKNEYFKLFDANYDKYVYFEQEVIETLISQLDYNDKQKKFKNFDFSYFFDIKFNYEQKKALLKDIAAFRPTEYIKDYVDESFSAKQIEYLADALHRGEKIKNACNSSFSIEHMRHIVFFNSKSIVFKNDEDYDTKFVEYKNSEYKRFIEVYDNLEKMSYRRMDSIMPILRFLSRLNTEYNMSIDIDNVLNSEIYLESEEIYKILDRAIKHNIDAGIYFNGKFDIAQMDILETALEENITNDDLFNPKLPASKMKDILNYELYLKEMTGKDER